MRFFFPYILYLAAVTETATQKQKKQLKKLEDTTDVVLLAIMNDVYIEDYHDNWRTHVLGYEREIRGTRHIKDSTIFYKQMHREYLEELQTVTMIYPASNVNQRYPSMLTWVQGPDSNAGSDYGRTGQIIVTFYKGNKVLLRKTLPLDTIGRSYYSTNYYYGTEHFEPMDFDSVHFKAMGSDGRQFTTFQLRSENCLIDLVAESECDGYVWLDNPVETNNPCFHVNRIGLCQNNIGLWSHYRQYFDYFAVGPHKMFEDVGVFLPNPPPQGRPFDIPMAKINLKVIDVIQAVGKYVHDLSDSGSLSDITKDAFQSFSDLAVFYNELSDSYLTAKGYTFSHNIEDLLNKLDDIELLRKECPTLDLDVFARALSTIPSTGFNYTKMVPKIKVYQKEEANLNKICVINFVNNFGDVFYEFFNHAITNDKWLKEYLPMSYAKHTQSTKTIKQIVCGESGGRFNQTLAYGLGFPCSHIDYQTDKVKELGDGVHDFEGVANFSTPELFAPFGDLIDKNLGILKGAFGVSAVNSNFNQTLKMQPVVAPIGGGNSDNLATGDDDNINDDIPSAINIKFNNKLGHRLASVVMINKTLSWDDANAACQNQSLGLPVPKSANDVAILSAFLEHTGTYHYNYDALSMWVGLRKGVSGRMEDVYTNEASNLGNYQNSKNQDCIGVHVHQRHRVWDYYCDEIMNGQNVVYCV